MINNIYIFKKKPLHKIHTDLQLLKMYDKPLQNKFSQQEPQIFFELFKIKPFVIQRL